jgi:DNA-binding NarL/FixJ family response regulator
VRPNLASKGVADAHAGGASHSHVLSKRQGEVLDLVKEGFDNAEIARELGISVRTVRAHTDALKAKLKVRRRCELIRTTHRQAS